MKKLLAPRPSERLSAVQALGHTWVAQMARRGAPPQQRDVLDRALERDHLKSASSASTKRALSEKRSGGGGEGRARSQLGTAAAADQRRSSSQPPLERSATATRGIVRRNSADAHLAADSPTAEAAAAAQLAACGQSGSASSLLPSSQGDGWKFGEASYSPAVLSAADGRGSKDAPARRSRSTRQRSRDLIDVAITPTLLRRGDGATGSRYQQAPGSGERSGNNTPEQQHGAGRNSPHVA